MKVAFPQRLQQIQEQGSAQKEKIQNTKTTIGSDSVSFGKFFGSKKAEPLPDTPLSNKELHRLSRQVNQNSRFRKLITGLIFISSGISGYVLNDTLTEREKYPILESAKPVISTAPKIDRLTPEKLAQSSQQEMQLKKDLHGLSGRVFNHDVILADYTLTRTVGIRSARSIGSGFIYSKDGFIITNAHVVGKNPIVEVMLNNGKTGSARVIGVDKDKDIAVIKVESKAFDLKELPVLSLAKPNSIKPGQRVMAVGHPLGLSWSISTGSLSSTNRMQIEGSKMLQTDTAINPGNSGGPLVNMAGELIGINTIVVPSAENIAFSISLEELIEIIPKLISQSDKSNTPIGKSLPNLFNIKGKL